MWFTYPVSGDFKLLQFYDDYALDPVTQEGTKWIYEADVIENGSVSVHARSNDRDVVGLVARARDNTHYYRFGVDERNQVATIVVRDGSSFQTLASMPISVDFSTTPSLEFSVQGNLLEGTVDGQTVVATDLDWTYAAGRVGMYSYAMSAVEFDDFLLDRDGV